MNFISNCVAVHYGFQVKHNSTLSSSVSFSSVNYFSALTVVCLATFIVINKINKKSSAVWIRPCHLFQFKVTSEIMNRLRFGRTPWKGDQPDAKLCSTGQHDTERRNRNFRAFSGIRDHDRSIQAAKTKALDCAATVIKYIKKQFKINTYVQNVPKAWKNMYKGLFYFSLV